MSDYKEANIDIDQINPDFENPRHPVFENIDQIYEYMFAKSKLTSLIKDIAKHGISPLERFAVLETNGVYITLEGNRRLTALKALNDPSQVPVKYREDVVKAADGFVLPSTIVCVVYTERRDADIWIARKHQGESNGIGPTEWDTEAKSRQKERAGNQRDNNSLAIRFYDYAKKYLGLAESNLITIPMLTRWLSNPIFRDFVGFHSDETASSKKPKRITSKMYFDYASQLLIGHLYPTPPPQQSVNKAYVIDQVNNWRATSGLPKKNFLKVPVDIEEPDPFNPDAQSEVEVDVYTSENRNETESSRGSVDPDEQGLKCVSTSQKGEFFGSSDEGHQSDKDYENERREDIDDQDEDHNGDSGSTGRGRINDESKRTRLLNKTDLKLKGNKYSVYRSVLGELINLSVKENPIAVCFLARSVIERIAITYFETIMGKSAGSKPNLGSIYTQIGVYLKQLELDRSINAQAQNLSDLGESKHSNFSSKKANAYVHTGTQPIAHESINRDFDNFSAILQYMVAQINIKEASS